MIGAEPDLMDEQWSKIYRQIIGNICKILAHVGVKLTSTSSLVYTLAGRSSIPLDASDPVDLCFNLWVGLFFWAYRLLAYDRRIDSPHHDFKKRVLGYLESLAALIRSHNEEKYGAILTDDVEGELSEALTHMAEHATNVMNRLDHRVPGVSRHGRLVNATGGAKQGDSVVVRGRCYCICAANCHRRFVSVCWHSLCPRDHGWGALRGL